MLRRFPKIARGVNHTNHFLELQSAISLTKFQSLKLTCCGGFFEFEEENILAHTRVRDLMLELQA